jgi:flagellar protein FliS
MDNTARQAYLETQILTSTPQRLRLMLIEGAIRRARVAQEAWREGNVVLGLEAAGECRNIVTELIGGIQPDQTPLARQVLGIYMYLFSTLVEAQLSRDPNRLTDILRVLEEERQTWQAVCRQMPDRPANSTAAEEVAPQRVAEDWSPSYVPAPAASRITAAAPAFSIDA